MSINPYSVYYKFCTTSGLLLSRQMFKIVHRFEPDTTFDPANVDHVEWQKIYEVLALDPNKKPIWRKPSEVKHIGTHMDAEYGTPMVLQVGDSVMRLGKYRLDDEKSCWLIPAQYGPAHTYLLIPKATRPADVGTEVLYQAIHFRDLVDETWGALKSVREEYLMARVGYPIPVSDDDQEEASCGS